MLAFSIFFAGCAAEKGCDMSGVKAKRIPSVEERKAAAKKAKEDVEATQETNYEQKQ